MENLNGQDNGQGQELEPGAEATRGEHNDATDTGNAQSDEGRDSVEEALNADVPPELEETKKNLLRDYHRKTEKLAEKERLLQAQYGRDSEDAKALREIAQQEWFKKAIAAERGKRQGQPQEVEVTDEEFAAAQQDKSAFFKLVAKMVKAGVDGSVSGDLDRQKNELRKLREEREYERLVDKYDKEFTEAHEAGHLEDDVRRGYSLEDAFARFVMKNRHAKPKEQDIEAEVERRLSGKKSGAVSKPGAFTPRGVRVVQVEKGDFNTALDLAWEAAQKGEKLKIERKR